MKRYIFLILTVGIFILFATGTCYAWEETLDKLTENNQKVYEHPFMLADSERLERLAGAGDEEPWKTMKQTAVKQAAASLISRNGRGDLAMVRAMYDIINYNALAYILDSENAEVYKNNILAAIAYFDKDNPDTVFGCIYTEDGDNWNGSIPPGNTFASAVIALDILHPSLTDEEIAGAEAALQCVADAFWAKTEVHLANTWGVRGLWAAYNQDYALLKQCYGEWLYQYNDSVNADGGQLASVEYAYVRYAASERNAKILLPYVMEYMGIDNIFYSNEKYINAIEHLLGYTYAPNGEFWIFGDTSVGSKINSRLNLAAYVAPKYSRMAAGYGAYILKKDYGIGTMLKLLLGNDDGSLTEAAAPKSRIFRQTGAFFYENHADENSLAGVMYNQDKTAKVNGHSHTESNSIGLYAYGKMLMANSGYAGFQKSSLGYTWNYIQTSAVSANTVLINYDPVDITNPSETNNHNNQWKYKDDYSYTNGIVNGFTDELLCYAKGDSGNAIPNGKHYRSFVMVSSQNTAPGYFIEFDEISTNNANDVATVIQRPLSTDYEQITENTEYKWTISDDVSLSVFMANKPDSVEFWDGVAASTSSPVELKSMFSKYSSGSDKNINICTVLFPSDADNPKSDMERIEMSGASGVKISHPDGITDYVFASEGEACSYAPEELLFEAKNIIARKTNDANQMYFAEAATRFECQNEGFEAENAVTVFMNGNIGKAEAEADTRLMFFKENLSGIKINGEPVTPVMAGKSRIIVTIPAGVSEIELLCNSEEADEAKSVILLEEHFEESKTFEGWAAANGGEASRGYYDDGGNGVYRIRSAYTSGSTGNADSVLQFTQTMEDVFEMKFKVKMYSRGKVFQLLFKSQDAKWVDVFAYQGEEFQIPIGTKYDGITVDKAWNDFSVAVDTKSRKIKVTRNTQLIYTGTIADDFSFENVQIRFQAYTSSVGNTVDAYIDDLYMIQHPSGEQYGGIVYETDFDGCANELISSLRSGWATAGGSLNTSLLELKEYNGSDALHSVAIRPADSDANADSTANISGGAFFEGHWFIEADVIPVSTGSKFAIAFREEEKASDYWYPLFSYYNGVSTVCGAEMKNFEFLPGGVYSFKIYANLYDNTATVYVNNILYAENAVFANEPADASKYALRIQNITSGAGENGEFYIDNLSIRYKTVPHVTFAESDDGTVTADVTFPKDYGSAAAVLAVYEGNRLADVDFEAIAADDICNNVTLKAENSFADDKRISVMIINSMKNVCPAVERIDCK